MLTTDHKRIGLLYLFSITGFFFLGGFFALLVRLELLTPAADLMTPDVYNRAFTAHGVIMVFFFLIPSIPATLGNFMLPIMVGAKDLAFPRINLLSWYIYILAGVLAIVSLVGGGVDTGWTFYTPYSSMSSNSRVLTAALGVFVAGFSSILTGLNFIVTVHRMRAPGHDVVPAAALRVGALCDQPDHDPGDAGHRDHDPAARVRARAARRHLRPVDRRRSGALPAPVLVLLAPGRLHHGAAGDGRHLGARRLLLAEERLRLQLRRLLEPGNRDHRVPGLGPPHVRVGPDGVLGPGLLDHHVSGRGALGGEDLQLDSDALQGIDLGTTRRCSMPSGSSACSSSAA